VIKELYVLTDIEAISHKAASVFVEFAESAITSKGNFYVAVSGGSTPRRTFALLSSEYRDKVKWDCVQFFWVDERCVPKEHKESNFKLVYDLLLSKVPLPEVNIHRIRGEQDPAQEALRYEKDIKTSFDVEGFPVFDLIMLGMGEDGHTASLFPNSDALNETERLAIPVYVEKLKSQRITLTLPVLNNAACVLFLVSGSSKSDVLSYILGSEGKKYKYPAGLVNPAHGELIWLVDKEAAAKLKQVSDVLNA